MRTWLVGSRPRTLAAAVVPVAVGAANAFSGTDHPIRVGLVFCALIVSVALQVGVNYANDYSDGIRGTDRERVGPLRLVGSGTVEPRLVKRAAFLAFGVSAAAGLVIAINTSLWLLLLGAACILAAWFYTGGPRPYGYAGLGEAFVFVFFGLVATMGTSFAAVSEVDSWGVLPGSAVGVLAVLLLVVNNLRDIPGDVAAGKRTLAVRMGDAATRWFYVALVVAFYVLVLAISTRSTWASLVFASAPLSWSPMRSVLRGARGADLVPVLGATARLQLVAGVLLAVGLAIG